MKDRYLFRGKRKNGQGWAYGDLNQHPIHYECCILENGVINHSVIPETVGQFTGLVDKNVVKIFDGDKIRSFDSKGNEIIHIVMFDKEEARFALMPIDASQWDTPMRLTQSWVREFNKEVIGSIHDNN